MLAGRRRRFFRRQPFPCPAGYAGRPAGIPRRDRPCRHSGPGAPPACRPSAPSRNSPLSTPQVPPWPEQRSITSTSASGISRSISAAFWPMFCARAWQARCSATPPSSGFRPGARPSLLGDVDDIFADVEGGAARALDVRVLGQDQRPFEFQHQRAGRHQRDRRRSPRRSRARALGDDACARRRPRARDRPAPAAACRSSRDRRPRSRRRSSPAPRARPRRCRACCS